MRKISVTLYERESNGKKHLYANIYGNGKRKQKTLHLFLFSTPRTTAEREHNKHAKILAQKKCNEIESDLLNNRFDFQEVKSKNFGEFFLEVIKDLQDKGTNTANVYQDVYNCLQRKTEILNLDFADFNKKNCVEIVNIIFNMPNYKESTKHLHFRIFSAVFNRAFKLDYIKENYLSKVDKPTLAKKQRVFLTMQEIEKLEKTPCRSKFANAFLFSCFSGLRYSDVRTISKDSVIEENGKRYIKLIQKKGNKFNIVPVTTKALKYIDNFTDFSELSENCGVNQFLKRWAKKAEISKNITFHTARHSFASNALINGANIVSISKTLGHSNISTTMIYADMTRANIYDELETAFN